METNITENIVMSSRVRLARNIVNIPFQGKLIDLDLANSITKAMYEVLEDNNEFTFIRLKNLDNIRCLTLLERRLISKELIDNKDISAVAINSDETISVMINEEDHIRAQCFMKGLNLFAAYEKLDDIDNKILAKLDIAFTKELGFITACPTNLGTGMRASVMLFLPALTMSGEIYNLISSVSNFGLTVRGIYGESSKAEGYMYQISNQISLGISEKEIIKNVNKFVIKICEMEDVARGRLIERNYDELRDIVTRAYGILTNCYKISGEEFMKLLSELRLGVSLGLIEMKQPEIIDEIFISAQSAHLTEQSGKELSALERDKYRAEYIHRTLKNLRIS